MNQAKETNNPVKEYKEKIKRLNQKELIKAFNNANPDRVKSKEEKERDEYFEAKKKALKEYYDAMVAKIELERGIELARYIESSKSEKKSVIQRWIKQYNINIKKERKEYHRLYNKAYYQLNKEHCKANVRKYRKDNLIKIKEWYKSYNKLNKERIQAIKKIYYETHKEKFILRSKNYRENNLTKVNEYHKEYIKKRRKENKNGILEKSRNRQKIYRQKNKEKIREANKIYNKEYLARPEVKNKRNSYYREKRAKLKALKLQQATQEIKEGV